MKAPVLILEGSWWSKQEAPKILPYFQAYESSHGFVKVNHRTFWNIDDIKYHIKSIPKNAGAMVYFACHGSEGKLDPSDGRSKIDLDMLCEAIKSNKKENAISFLHFGACEFIPVGNRREVHEKLMDASGARWVSGYTQSIEWLQSTFLDLALIDDVYCRDYGTKDKRGIKINDVALQFISDYEQTARRLGFSALAHLTSIGKKNLFPKRLHDSEN